MTSSAKITGFKLDHKGLSTALRTQFAEMINAKAEEIATTVRAIINDAEVPVEVDEYTTDRNAAAVVIAHPRGVSLQASMGALSRAAAQYGLEVTLK